MTVTLANIRLFIKCNFYLFIFLFFSLTSPFEGCPQVWCSDQKGPAGPAAAAVSRTKRAQQDGGEPTPGQERPVGDYSQGDEDEKGRRTSTIMIIWELLKKAKRYLLCVGRTSQPIERHSKDCFHTGWKWRHDRVSSWFAFLFVYI